MKHKALELDRDRKKALVDGLIAYIDDEWEQEIGLLKAELLLDFLTDNMGKELYNRGVTDSRKFVMKTHGGYGAGHGSDQALISLSFPSSGSNREGFLSEKPTCHRDSPAIPPWYGEGQGSGGTCVFL